MARINRSDVIQKAVNDLSLSASDEKIPNETLDKVQLVYSLNKQFSNVCVTNAYTTTQTLVTQYTIGANEDFYLTSFSISNMSDVTADNTLIRLKVTINGISRELCTMVKLTTTAFSDSISMSFPYPLKLDKGTTIQFGNAFAAGASTSKVMISGMSFNNTL